MDDMVDMDDTRQWWVGPHKHSKVQPFLPTGFGD